MIVALLLLSYAGGLSVLAPRVLTGRGWTVRAPRLAVAAWQVLIVSVLAATFMAGLALAVPTVPIRVGLSELLRACEMALRAGYATPGHAAMAATGLLLSGGVALRLGYWLVRWALTVRRQRRAHLDALTLVGRPSPELGAVVVGHAAAAAYCLPGRHRRIVLTSAALGALDGDQLRAVLGHELAHLRGRHDLVLALADVVARALPFVPLFIAARGELRALIEMVADDVAAGDHDRDVLASALLSVAEGSAPAATLAAGGPTAAVRIRRMLSPAHPLTRMSRFGVGLTVGAAFFLPIFVAGAPAAMASNQPYCPVGEPTSLQLAPVARQICAAPVPEGCTRGHSSHVLRAGSR